MSDREKIIEALEQGCTDQAAAAMASMTVDEFHAMRESDPVFARRCSIASSKAEATLTMHLFGAEKKDASGEFMLACRFGWRARGETAEFVPPDANPAAVIAELRKLLPKEDPIPPKLDGVPGGNEIGQTLNAPGTIEPDVAQIQGAKQLEALGHVVTVIEGCFVCSKCHETIPPVFIQAAAKCQIPF